MAEKKHSLRSKRFQVKIGASAKKCIRSNFYAVKKAKNASNLRKRLLRRLKTLKGNSSVILRKMKVNNYVKVNILAGIVNHID